MAKNEKKVDNLKLEITDDGDLKLSISEEAQEKIPRVGDKIVVIQPFAADDEDEGEDGKVKEDAILQYSYAKRMVRASVLSEDNEHVLINGDYKLPLNENMRIESKKLMVYTSEEAGREKWRSLMNTSAEAARELENKYRHIRENLDEAIEKNFH